ncbi:MAG: nicotinic acid mononucleotide adenyltransferase [Flavobacteriaceae bacterium]|nr:nicotinic acid mononucleotide adenyltransferase [Flavobacteriaceae bacterium]
MKTLILFSKFALVTLLFTSCFAEDAFIEEYPPANISLNTLLNSYDLWYVEINQTLGYGQTPFLQKAFTMSFINGEVLANNNLVGIGSQGNGYGISIGYFDTYDMVLDVSHDYDGFYSFDVFQIDNNTIELYNPFNDTSYFLSGHQRNSFDYDFVFYDNIHYFLQEYEAWEKRYTSATGAINDFDYENYLQFLSSGNAGEFRSSQDENGLYLNNIYWDYTGIYNILDVSGNAYLKILTLDYDLYGNETFELHVINDGLIALFNPQSGTTYQFEGRGYIQYDTSESAFNVQSKALRNGKNVKLRTQKTKQKDNPRINKRTK